MAVSAGDAVRKGQKLLSIEAMKMETTIYAERPGRVADVLAVVGRQVKTGELLLKLSPEGAPQAGLRQRSVDRLTASLNLRKLSGFILCLYGRCIQPVVDRSDDILFKSLDRFGLGDATRKARHLGPVAATFDLMNLGNDLERDAKSASHGRCP